MQKPLIVTDKRDLVKTLSLSLSLSLSLYIYIRCVRACVRACVCVRARACVCVCVFQILPLPCEDDTRFQTSLDTLRAHWTMTSTQRHRYPDVVYRIEKSAVGSGTSTISMCVVMTKEAATLLSLCKMYS